MNTPKTYDNTAVESFLMGYFNAKELCDDFPCADDILTGVLEAKTAGDSSTRSLSRGILFRLLQSCSVVSVEAFAGATRGRYAKRTLQTYTLAARVASRALAGLAQRIETESHPMTIKEARRLIDDPYHEELRERGLI